MMIDPILKAGSTASGPQHRRHTPARPDRAGAAAMRILYVGAGNGTSLARFHALQRLGHDAAMVDPYRALPRHRLLNIWSFRTGALGLDGIIARRALSGTSGRFDLAIVDNGELVGPAFLAALRRLAPAIVNLNLDNPYVARDGRRWRLFLKALPGYDIVLTPRDSSVPAAIARGARDARRIWQAADDPLRDPANRPDAAAQAPYRSRVSFTGTWMPERGRFMAELIDRGVPLRIIGPRWDRAPEYAAIRKHVQEGWLTAAEYQAAVAAADISIALLSKGNRDIHTTRSLEIPALGSLLCGERTADHLALYEDKREAFFWNDAAECAAICLALLDDPARLAAARAAGFARALANGHFNETLMAGIIDAGVAACPR